MWHTPFNLVSHSESYWFTSTCNCVTRERLVFSFLAECGNLYLQRNMKTSALFWTPPPCVLRSLAAQITQNVKRVKNAAWDETVFELVWLRPNQDSALSSSGYLVLWFSSLMSVPPTGTALVILSVVPMDVLKNALLGFCRKREVGWCVLNSNSQDLINNSPFFLICIVVNSN